jgi:anti-sigma regulatory factor (Ser/Thr protein kinase)
MGYPMTLRSVRLARLQARRRLTMWQWDGDIDDAVLVVSELVANAVRHARVIGQELWLRLAELEDGGLVVEVSDPVRVFPEVAIAPDGEGGRGLLVVAQLAEELRWFLRSDVGKTVRARLKGRT